MKHLSHSHALLALTFTLLASACGPTTPAVVGTPVSNFNDSGAGSLRALLEGAKSGDTLTFTQKGEVKLSSPLVINKNLILDGAGSTLNAQQLGRVMEVEEGAQVTVKNITLSGGKALGTLGLQKQAMIPEFGGAIKIKGKFTLGANAVVQDNTANGGGGIHVLEGATLTIDGGTVRNNTVQPLTGKTSADGSGGGILNEGTLNLISGTLEGNTALKMGGAIFAYPRSVINLQGGTLTNNRCTRPIVEGGCGGGAVNSFGTVNLSGSTIKNNQATYYGGGIASIGVTGVLVMSGGLIEGNSNDLMGGAGGGGIYSEGKQTLLSGGTIRMNTSESGGGVNAWSDVTLTGTTIENNTGMAAGGVEVVEGTFTMKGGMIRNNASNDPQRGRGGGVGVSEKGTFRLEDGNITGNTSHRGGGIRVHKGKLFVIGGSISKNTATGDGGGVFLEDTATFTQSGGSIDNNKGVNGGGVYISPLSSFLLENGKVQLNTATGQGGGVYRGGTFTQTGGTVTGNTPQDIQP